MITIMKKYENPMLQIVSIKQRDIVTASPTALEMGPDLNIGTIEAGAADRFRDFDAGY
jgi:hypothetical protein